MTDLHAGTARAAPRRTGPRLGDNSKLLGWVFLAPALLYVFGLVGFPFILSLVYSVTSVTVSRVDLTFKGLDNFIAATQNAYFFDTLRNTILYTLISQACVLFMANALALALIKNFRGKWFVRLLILLPFVAPISLGTIGWLWIFDSIYSVINWTLRAWGLLPPPQWLYWLGQPYLAKSSIIIVNVWRTLPLATVIVLAGLGSIPQDIHDAARMDGARFWRHHFQVTIPLTLPINLVALLFGTVFTFTDMVVVFILTRGGPFNSTHNLSSMAWYTGIEAGDLSGGAAISLFMFPILAVVAIVLLLIARRSEVT